MNVTIHPCTQMLMDWKDWENEDLEHLMDCTQFDTCGSCLKSKKSCGWCPYSGLCVPLSRYETLLSPIRNDNICPMPRERYELRTQTLGCNCSTTTFLTAIITCLATLAGLVILYGLVKAIKWMTVLMRTDKYGTLVDYDDEGRGDMELWVRKQTWKGWWRGLWRKRGEGITEEEDLLG